MEGIGWRVILLQPLHHFPPLTTQQKYRDEEKTNSPARVHQRILMLLPSCTRGRGEDEEEEVEEEREEEEERRGCK